MQQRFTEKELQQLASSNKHIFKAVSVQDLLGSAWLNETTVGGKN